MERSQRVVVFDLGGVLVPADGVLAALSHELGTSPEVLAEPYWTGRRDYDLGRDDDRYWSGVLAGLGRAREPGLVSRLRALDAREWSQLPPVSTEILRTVAQAEGVRTALLSNAPGPLATAVRRAGWSQAMDVLVFSAELGLAKPDPRIYAAADDACGCDPQDVIFFDDRPENVSAARAHGWDAHLWQDPRAAMAVLAERGIR